jgi:hypothetical protein
MCKELPAYWRSLLFIQVRGIGILRSSPFGHSAKFATRKQRPSNTKIRHFEDALPPLNVYAGPTMQRGRAEGPRPYMEGGGNKCCAEGSLTYGDPSYLSDYVGTPRDE